MKKRNEIFIDTDVLEENLLLRGGSPLLRKCLGMFECFTSVVNAAEVFEKCFTRGKLEKAKKSFYGINILGIPFRYSLGISEIKRKIRKKNLKITMRDAIIMAMCRETELPLLTLNDSGYRKSANIISLQLINKNLILHNSSAEEVLRKAKIYS